MNFKLIVSIVMFMAMFSVPTIAQEQFTLTDSADNSTEIIWPVIEKSKTPAKHSSTLLDKTVRESSEVVEDKPTFVSLEISEISEASRISLGDQDTLVVVPVPTPQEVDALEVQSKQITFLTADNAELIPSDKRVAIIAENVDSKKSYGVMLKIENQVHDWIEVHSKSNPFPPRIVDPFKEDVYLLVGDPGEVFFISVRSNDDRPTWIEVQIEGDGSETGGIVGKWSALQQISQTEADKVGDSSTRVLLAEAYTSALVDMDNMSLLDAKKSVVKARKSALRARTTFESNWFVYLQKVGSEADKAESTADYKAAIYSIIAGLRPPVDSTDVPMQNVPVTNDVLEDAAWRTRQNVPTYAQPQTNYNPVVDNVGCGNGCRVINGMNNAIQNTSRSSTYFR